MAKCLKLIILKRKDLDVVFVFVLFDSGVVFLLETLEAHTSGYA